ncbi:MAG: TIM barrel protein [Candidatus Hodarchaeales archaeon]
MSLNISIGISMGISRFISQDRTETKLDQIKSANLNSIEFGLLNCTIGKSMIPGTTPYPSEKQCSAISELFPSDQFYTSVHAPYRISATSEEESKLRFSKANLSATLKVADWLNSSHVTFHAGSFKGKKHNYDHVKNVLKNWEEWRLEKEYKARLAPEVGGKYNSFADFFTLVEIAGEIENCLITWDISHDFARGGNITTEEGILKRLELLDSTFDLNPTNRLPMHFSGMVVGKTGEKNHTLLGKGGGVPWEMVFSTLREQKFLSKVNLTCESKVPKGEKLKGNAISDAVKARNFLISDTVVKKYKGKPGNLDFYFN